MIYISGPGHGGQAMVGNTYLEGTYSEVYPDIARKRPDCRSSSALHTRALMTT